MVGLGVGAIQKASESVPFVMRGSGDAVGDGGFPKWTVAAWGGCSPALWGAVGGAPFVLAGCWDGVEAGRLLKWVIAGMGWRTGVGCAEDGEAQGGQ